MDPCWQAWPDLTLCIRVRELMWTHSGFLGVSFCVTWCRCDSIPDLFSQMLFSTPPK